MKNHFSGSSSINSSIDGSSLQIARPFDVAIIGMSCRFPGGVNSPAEFFDFLLQAGDGIVSVPTDRWENSAYHDVNRERKSRMYVARGGFIQDIDQFDPLFFGISPAEAAKLDPQHRWLLELTYEAIENAGLKAKDLKGSDTAVYIGQFMHDYEQLQLDSMAKDLITNLSATGCSMTMTANRISYTFDFKGPSVTLDTACSSSLVAIDFACKALLNGDSALAVAGGVNILLRPEMTMAVCKASMLSPDGKCKSFDALADGYVRSEGAGIVLLKRLADAERDGDPILAVIKSSGVNQDGQTPGITVPSGDAQISLLQKSLDRAGLTGADIQYVEAHGTGTAVGDPIEINGLGSIVGIGRPVDDNCIIGSVKSNIGHTEAAAGMAGLIKTVMAMNHGVIPQNLHLYNVNPAIRQQDFSIRFADSALPWPEHKNTPRRALVNSFGFGGTNANLILEQASQPASALQFSEQVNQSVNVLLISSKTESGLRDQAASYRQFFDVRNQQRQQNETLPVSLSDVCFTAAVKREHHKYRVTVSGGTEEEIINGLDLFLRGEPSLHWTVGVAGDASSDLCFVYSGMGTQWAGMGRALYQTEPVFRYILDQCSHALQQYSGWSLIDALFTENEHSLEDTYVAQPGIFSVQAALTGLLKSWGIEPKAIVGHSAGEVCAAYAAGVYRFEDAIRVIYHRSRLQQTTEGTGKMLAVGLKVTALAPYLKGFEQTVSIAAINSEEAITLAGDESALVQIASKLEDAGIFARFLQVGVPYHSPVMDQLKTPLIEALTGIKVFPPQVPLYSTVSGKLTSPEDWGPEYWAQNIREPVLFQAAIQAIAADGICSFLEVSPHAALSSSIEKNLAQANARGWSVHTLKRGTDDALMLAAALGNLHGKGWPVDWQKILPIGRFVPLPNYAWQHASYWSEAVDVQRVRLKNISGRSGFADSVHPLLGGKLQSNAHFWQNKLELQSQPFLADHQVENEPVYPAAGYIEMFLAAVNPEAINRPIYLEEIAFKRAFFLDPEKSTILETGMDDSGTRLFINGLDPQTEQWNSYSGAICVEPTRAAQQRTIDIQAIQARLHTQSDQAQFYAHCHQQGLTYQAAFQPVKSAWYAGDEAFVELLLPEGLSSKPYQLHPALMDGSFQSIFAVVSGGCFLPVNVGVLRYYQKPDDHLFCFMQLTKRSPDEMKYNLSLCNPDGTVTVELYDITLKPTKMLDGGAENAATILYEYNWQPAHPITAPAPDDDGTWLIFADACGVAPRLVSALESRRVKGMLIDPISSPVSTNMISTDDFFTYLAPFAENCSGVVYLRALNNHINDQQNADQVFDRASFAAIEPMHLMQALDKVEWRKTPRIYFATQSVQLVENDDALPQPGQGALWGVGRVFATEYSSFTSTLLDLPASMDDEMMNYMLDQLLSETHEPEVAIRAGGRYVNRLRVLNESLLHRHAEQPFIPSSHSPFQIVAKHNRAGSNPFDLVALQLPHLSPQSVQINVSSAALPRDVDAPFCTIAGIVTEVGAAVDGYAKGDDVTGFALGGSGSVVQATLDLVVKIPHRFSVEEAGALPSAFLPACFAVDYVGLLREGEHILIHNADEAIGLAAIQFAKRKRAVIYATTFSTEGRQKLLGLGVNAVYFADDYSLYEAIFQATGGRGIDLVLNAMTDRSVSKSMAILKPYGRYVDFSEKSTALLDVISTKSISYHRFDLGQLIAQRPDLCGRLLAEIVSLFNEGCLQPMVLPTFELGQLSQAADFIQLHSPLQVALLSFAQLPTLVAAGLDAQIVKPNGSYLVTGGLGGLGLDVMQWLAGKGAQSIVLIGRSAPSAQAQQVIDAVLSRGISVSVLSADIAKVEDVVCVLQHIETNLPALAGIIHAAGVLDDGIISQQTAARFQKVLAPKVKGAWNLHQLTAHLSLDFVVYFSSIASMIGSAGQSNYASANAFMDVLAQRRRASGQFATSIHWGPWSGSGMAARLDEREQQRMKDSGMSALSVESALTAMEQLLKHRVVQAGVFEVDWQRMFGRVADRSRYAVFADLVGETGNTSGVNLQERLKSAPALERQAIVTEITSSVLASILEMESGDVIDRDKNIVEYGANSLMSMDLRNQLQTALSMKLPATFTLKYGTVNAMTGYILENLNFESTEKNRGVLYWDPQAPDLFPDTEINGRLATLTPTILNWIREGHTARFTEGMFIEVAEEIFDLTSLKKALQIALTYHDVARSQFFIEDGQLQQEIVSLQGAVEIEQHDFSALDYEVAVQKMSESNNRLHQSFRFERGCPLYRVAYYKVNHASPHRLFVVFHHYLVDAVSMTIFLRDLLQTSGKIMNNQPVLLPVKTYSYFDWTQRLKQFSHDEAYAQLPYWLEKIEKSHHCFIPNEIAAKPDQTVNDYVKHIEHIEPEMYAQVVDFCKIKNYEVSDFFTYAFIKAFSRLTGSESLWVEMMKHARMDIFADVAIPDLFGQICENAALLFELLPNGTLDEQIAIIRQQRTGLPNGGIGLRALRFLNQSPEVQAKLAKDESPQVSLNFVLSDYADQIKNDQLHFVRESISIREAENVTHQDVRRAFNFHLSLRNGDVLMEMNYYRNRFSPDTIERLAQDFFAVLAQATYEMA